MVLVNGWIYGFLEVELTKSKTEYFELSYFFSTYIVLICQLVTI